MAVLEKIRQKQAFLFTVIIIALFLFIISLDSNVAHKFLGLFTGDTADTMVKIGNTKIKQRDYSNALELREEQARQMYERQGMAFDAESYRQELLSQLAVEALLEKEYNALGIKVTDKEISNIMFGVNPVSMNFIGQISQDLQMPGLTAEQLYGWIQNPATSPYPEAMPQIQQVWVDQEDNVEKFIKSSAYQSLISGLFTANELDAKSAYNDKMDYKVLAYATAPVIGGDDVEITQDDLRKEWEKTKEAYYVDQPMRIIDYIQVEIVPSVADLTAAAQMVDEAEAALNEQPDLEALAMYPDFSVSTTEVAASDVKKMRGMALANDSILSTPGAVFRAPYNPATRTHMLAKVLGVDSKVDTINVTYVMSASAAENDSVMAQIAAGKTFEEFQLEDPRLVDIDRDLVINGPNAVRGIDFLKDFVLEAPLGTPQALNDSTNGTFMVMQVNSRVAPKNFVNLAQVTYEVNASGTTEADLLNELTSYVASNHNAKAFRENANDSVHSYVVQTLPVNAATPRIGMINDSRQTIKWAMNKAKVGDVSNVQRSQLFNRTPSAGTPMREVYYAVAVREADKPGFLPFTSVFFDEDGNGAGQALKRAAIVTKKGNEMIESYKGKAITLNEYAALMGTEVRTDSAYSSGANSFGTIYGRQSTLRGLAAAAADGQLVGPVLGDNEVVVFTVAPSDFEHRDYSFDTDGAVFVQSYGLVDPFSIKLLAGKHKINNNSLKFVVSDDERQ